MACPRKLICWHADIGPLCYTCHTCTLRTAILPTASKPHLSTPDLCPRVPAAPPSWVPSRGSLGAQCLCAPLVHPSAITCTYSTGYGCKNGRIAGQPIMHLSAPLCTFTHCRGVGKVHTGAQSSMLGASSGRLGELLIWYKASAGY